MSEPLGRDLIGWASPIPNPAPFNGVFLLGNDASSSYHALQVQFNRRLSNRLHVLLSYTWSHSIDNLSNDSQYLGETRSLAQYLDPNIDRGSSDFDVRHSLNGSLIAALPSPKKGIPAALFRNWTANSIFFARSALPTDLLGTPQDFMDRPDLVPGQPLYLYSQGYPGGKAFNSSAFKGLPVGMEGDLGRNILRGLGAWQIDFAFHRDFRLAERVNLQFRAEAFNILNHPNFANASDSNNPGHLTLSQSRNFGAPTQMLATGLGPAGVPGQLSPLFQIGGPAIGSICDANSFLTPRKNSSWIAHSWNASNRRIPFTWRCLNRRIRRCDPNVLWRFQFTFEKFLLGDSRLSRDESAIPPKESSILDRTRAIRTPPFTCDVSIAEFGAVPKCSPAFRTRL
ncbi:MAG: hypothetical protein WDO73_12460 [Ignavibacteriota bacterium]